MKSSTGTKQLPKTPLSELIGELSRNSPSNLKNQQLDDIIKTSSDNNNGCSFARLAYLRQGFLSCDGHGNVCADDEPTPTKKKPGPVTPLERRFQEVKRLPKKKQDFILQFLDNMLESNPQKQKA
ncbi:MAG TPA: hypothetical protein PLN05_17575 [Pyrinomonadaceae bacterium]|nr:hypothetical protein [Chloracidobacterium sp.]HRK52232.1 hypothetical protein [Pyrinomonadaceae bacterium]